jgi:hypothetical protein
MASRSKLAEAYVDLKADGEQRVRATFGRVQTDLQKTHTKMLAVKSVISTGLRGALGALGIGLGIGAVIAFLNKTTEAALEAQKTQTKLRATLMATGAEVQSNVSRFNELAKTLADTTNTSKATTLSMVSLALNMGIGVDQIEAMTTSAIGLSEAIGVDAEDAMRALIKATEGNFKALDKAIPAVRNATTAEAKLAEIQKISNRGLQEKAALTRTVAGETEKFGMALKALYVSVGNLQLDGLIRKYELMITLVKVLTGGTVEHSIATLQLAKTQLQLAQAFDKVMGMKDAALDQKIIDIENQMVALENAQISADNKAANSKVKNMQMISEATKKAKNSSDEYWEANQKASENDPYIKQLKAEQGMDEKIARRARDRNEANRPKNMPKPEQQAVTPEQAAEVRARNNKRREDAVMAEAAKNNAAVAAMIKSSGRANFQSDYYRKKYGPNFDFGKAMSEKALDQVAVNESKKARAVADAGGTPKDFRNTTAAKTPTDDPIVKELQKLNRKLPQPAVYSPNASN